MDLKRFVPMFRWLSRIGMIGLILTLGITIGVYMLAQISGGPVDEKALVASAMPWITVFAFLAAGGAILVRILEGK
ncbi:hypothetical protein [Burkholderia glumae]|uniref:hypothetical protein n=1 Tax=Burkholderia glumae TaxID=337 RepID=UPI0021516171|nr:hypothetical protein [Burkholderia glumae]